MMDKCEEHIELKPHIHWDDVTGNVLYYLPEGKNSTKIVSLDWNNERSE